MNAGSRTPGPYEADPTPYLALLAITGGVFVSTPGLLVGIVLARVARRATAVFAALAAAGGVWVWLWWARIGLEMQRAQRAGERHGCSCTRATRFRRRGPTSGRGGCSQHRCASPSRSR